jgi:hypothetical protein
VTVSNIDYNKQDDDILRAEDVVPPYNTQKHSGQSFKDESPSLNANQLPHTGKDTTEPDHIVRKVSEIPKFDLAEQIMAEQRKITAIRRKAPGRKPKVHDKQPPIQSIGSTFELPVRALTEKDLVITEIVARDIEKLYRENSSNIKNW